MIRLIPIANSLEKLSKTQFYDESSLYQGFLEFLSIKTPGDISYIAFYNAKEAEFSRCYCSNIALNEYKDAKGATMSPALLELWYDSFKRREAVVQNYHLVECKDNAFCGIHGYKHHVVIALRSNDGEVVGVLGIAALEKPYQEKDASKLHYLALTAWELVCEKSNEMADRNKASITQFKASSTQEVLVNLMGAISKALELRDSYTSHHMRNVSVISTCIGKELGLDHQRLTGLEVGSLIHDIGKIALPSEILNKPGELSRPEYDLLKTHTTMGALMFEAVVLPWSIKDMILQHHERLDGTGYPGGRVGHEICLEAKIIAIADTFDAMSTDRPYRYSPGRDAALEVIKGGRCTKFDPYIVDAFLACYQCDTSFGGIYE
ncbi:HD-GYP domain-containing protein [Teredinibacter franksiae]|uniref:HD-GYP domain-containing protein n=1 Tax=Teredinibacter franksiae TaxID=2761453 RepID=UPI0016269035|nr:HD-GYP domain-containing protein [Teredinibacter franksiae]